MNDEERLRTLVRALLPFALAAWDSDVSRVDNDSELLVQGKWNVVMFIDDDLGGSLRVQHLRAALAALTAAGYADALTDDSARAALGSEE